MKQYIQLLDDIVTNGVKKDYRTDVGTKSVFGRQMRFDLKEGFPLLTTKKIHLKSVIHELLCFLQGDTNNNTIEDSEPMTYAELIESLCNTIPGINPEHFIVFKNGKDGQLTDEIITNDQIAINSDPYNDLLNLIQNTGKLHKKDIPITKPLGPIYGKQWCSWSNHDLKLIQDKINEIRNTITDPTCETQDYLDELSHLEEIVSSETSIDQITEVIELLKTNPNSQRLVVKAWNPNELPDESFSPQSNVNNGKMALAPCDWFLHFYTRPLHIDERLEMMTKEQEIEYRYMDTIAKTEREEAKLINAAMDELGVPRLALSCQLYQCRINAVSALPFNIASYALLTHMIAEQCGMAADEFVWTGGDAYIYKKHLTKEIVYEQLKREPGKLPKLKFTRKVDSIFDYEFGDFEFEGYDPQPEINVPNIRGR